MNWLITIFKQQFHKLIEALDVDFAGHLFGEEEVTTADKLEIIGWVLFLMMIQYIKNLRYIVYLKITIYDCFLIYCFILSVLWFAPPNRFFDVISIPFKIIYFLFLVSFSLIPTMILYIGYFLVVFIFTIYTPNLFFDKSLSDGTTIYIIITITAIWITTTSDRLVVAAFEHGKSKILNQRSVKILIYVIYFILIFISSVSQFNEVTIGKFGTNIDPIMQSFVTFIAFEQIRENINKTRK